MKKKFFPPGTFPPNPLGLHEMSGNMLEWVADWYDKRYYSRSPELNPKGPETGTEKVVRSGSALWDDIGASVYGRHSSTRTGINTKRRSDFGYGFRIALNKKEKPAAGNEDKKRITDVIE